MDVAVICCVWIVVYCFFSLCLVYSCLGFEYGLIEMCIYFVLDNSVIKWKYQSMIFINGGFPPANLHNTYNSTIHWGWIFKHIRNCNVSLKHHLCFEKPYDNSFYSLTSLWLQIIIIFIVYAWYNVHILKV